VGRLEEVLAAVDNARRVLGRNTSDLVNDPAGHLTKITDALRNTNAGVVPTATPTELTNRPLSPSERVEQTMGSLDFGGGLGVIKPKGGNWLSGKYGPEAALKSLRKTGSFGAYDAEELAGMMNMPLNEAKAFWATEPANVNKQALNDWIDKKLTRYVKNEMATPEDPVRLMADKFPAEKAAKLAEAEARVNALRQKQAAQATTRGVPEEYLTRTRQDVLKAEEARDLIAENTGLHLTPAQLNRFNPDAVLRRREVQGMPLKAIGATPEARAWENTADSLIGVGPAEHYVLPSTLTADPWLAKVDPSTTVYNLDDPYLFSHLTDELFNSLREGRLTPEQLSKMNMEQAVRHVAEINALRAVEANKARAMEMQGMPLHKEYPAEGMSWRQLKLGDLPEGWEADGMDIFGPGGTQIQAGAIGDPRREQLQRWLKQEGDAMGHCVGGYCDDVVSGSSNIYSLRDAKGQPYVTIETSPSSVANTDPDNPRAAAWIDARAKQHEAEFGDEAWDVAFEDYMAEAPFAGAADAIVQIKGKGNAAPDAKYLPFVQDFIRSGKWSDIGDAGNTGLTPDEINQLLGRK